MVTIPGLGLINDADIDGTLLFPVYDSAETGNQGKRITLDQIHQGYAADGEDASFDGLSLSGALTGTTASLTAVSFSTSLGFTGGATVSGLRRRSTTLSPGSISAAGNQDMTLTLSGAAIGDHVSLSFQSALPVGMTAQAWVSSAGTVTVRFANAGGSSIASASYTVSVAALRFA